MKHFIRNNTPIFLLVLFIAAIYINTINGEFVFDDYTSIILNKSIRELSNPQYIWQNNPTRFIGYLSLAVNYKIGGLDVTSYHIVNIFIHILTSVNVLIFLKLLLKTPKLINVAFKYQKLPFLASLLFAVHPIQTQAVTYITQRMASMGALFYIFALTFYLNFLLLTEDRQKKTIKSKIEITFSAVLSFIFASLAFFTKENTFTLPAILILLQLLFFKNSILAFLKKITLFLPIASFMSLIVILWRTQPQYMANLDLKSAFLSIKVDDISFFTSKFDYQYFITEFKVVIYYIYLYLLPLKQNIDHDFPLSSSFFDLTTFVSFILILSLISIALLIKKNNRLISFGILFYFLALTVESTLNDDLDVINEHRLYLPSLGLVLIASVILINIKRYISITWKTNVNNRASAIRIYNLTLFSLIFLLSVATISRNRIWQTKISLWNDAITKSPNKSRPYNNLGVALLEKKQYEAAADAFQKALDRRLSYADYLNLGNALYLTGNIPEAINSYDKAIELEPKAIEAYNALGDIYINLNQLDLAKQAYENSIKIFPNNPIANKGLSTFYYLRGDKNKAMEILDSCCR